MNDLLYEFQKISTFQAEKASKRSKIDDNSYNIVKMNMKLKFIYLFKKKYIKFTTNCRVKKMSLENFSFYICEKLTRKFCFV